MGNNIIVVKFGGSCLSNPSAVIKAAEKVAVEARHGTHIAVVVSALKGVTDELLDATRKVTSNQVGKRDLDEILSIGELTAVKLMTSALKSMGLDALGIGFHSDLWPIFTDSKFGNAKIDLEKTKEVVYQEIRPLLNRGSVPVIAGFIGLSSEGQITTLGRGGSDVTAVVLGSCLSADEVILVKDVGGVMSADPKKVSEPQTIDSLEAEEAYLLASAGAKVIHPGALKYKDSAVTLRVIGLDSVGLSGGTVINGTITAGLNASLHTSPLSMITLIGHDISSGTVLTVISEVAVTNARLLGVTLASSALLLYVENPSDLTANLHEIIKEQGIAKAIHSFDRLAMIVVSGYGLEKIPGIMDAVITPLTKENINIYGVFTISSSIRVFIPWEGRKRAMCVIDERLKKINI